MLSLHCSSLPREVQPCFSLWLRAYLAFCYGNYKAHCVAMSAGSSSLFIYLFLNLFPGPVLLPHWILFSARLKLRRGKKVPQTPWCIMEAASHSQVQRLPWRQVPRVKAIYLTGNPAALMHGACLQTASLAQGNTLFKGLAVQLQWAHREEGHRRSHCSWL